MENVRDWTHHQIDALRIVNGGEESDRASQKRGPAAETAALGSHYPAVATHLGILQTLGDYRGHIAHDRPIVRIASAPPV